MQKFQLWKLTKQQQQIWIDENIYPYMSMHNLMFISDAYIFNAEDIERLQRRLQRIVDENEALRTRLTMVGDNIGADVRQYFLPSEKAEFKVQHFASKAEMDTWLHFYNNESMELLGKSLYAVILLNVGKEYYFHGKFHHIISDGWSVNSVAKALTAAAQNLDDDILSKGMPYVEYIRAHEAYLVSAQNKADREFWQAELTDYMTLEMLPEKADIKVRSGAAKAVRYDLPQNLIKATVDYCDKNNITPYQLLLLVIYVVATAFTGKDDVVLGVTYHNRKKPFRDSFGMLVQLLPLRLQMENKTVAEAFRAVKGKMKEAILKHGQYPYQDIVHSLGKEKVIRGIVSDAGGASDGVGLYGDSMAGEIDFDINLNAGIPLGNGISRLIILWNEGIETKARDTFMNTLKTILGVICLKKDGDEMLLSSLPLIDEVGYNCLLKQYNDTYREYPNDMTVSQLFEAQALRTPDKIAVICGEKEYSYRELNGLANQAAAFLRKCYGKKDRLWVFMLERSEYYLSLMLGCWKNGQSFVPLLPDGPQEKNRDIIMRIASAGVIVQGERSENTTELQDIKNIINIEDVFLEKNNTGENYLSTDPADMAYMFFTSGSTGVPKGAMVTQRGMINHLYAKINDLQITVNDRVAQTASQTFDVSIWQFMSALLTGGTTVIFNYEEAWQPEKLLRTLEKKKISIVESVPSHMALILAAAENEKTNKYVLGDLRWFIMNGEGLPPEYCRRWFLLYPSIKMGNVYGPTECSDDVTHYFFNRIEHKTNYVPIGKPVQNTKIYILDMYQRILPAGIIGEIYVAGDGVGAGYYKDEKLTREIFLDDVISGQGWMYKTGDCGRWLTDGNLEFIGRKDWQIKISGQRIELGEIENAMLSHQGIKQAVVLSDGDERKYLVAYYTGEELDKEKWRRLLTKQLPEYMIPRHFVYLAEMPLNINGKVERSRLPHYQWQAADGETQMTAQERKLAAVFAAVLGLDETEVTATTDFFECGGNSLTAFVLLAAINKEYGRKENVSFIYNNRCVKTLCLYLNL